MPSHYLEQFKWSYDLHYFEQIKLKRAIYITRPSNGWFHITKTKPYWQFYATKLMNIKNTFLNFTHPPYSYPLKILTQNHRVILLALFATLQIKPNFNFILSKQYLKIFNHFGPNFAEAPYSKKTTSLRPFRSCRNFKRFLKRTFRTKSSHNEHG